MALVQPNTCQMPRQADGRTLEGSDPQLVAVVRSSEPELLSCHLATRFVFKFLKLSAREACRNTQHCCRVKNLLLIAAVRFLLLGSCYSSGRNFRIETNLEQDLYNAIFIPNNIKASMAGEMQELKEQELGKFPTGQPGTPKEQPKQISIPVSTGEHVSAPAGPHKASTAVSAPNSHERAGCGLFWLIGRFRPTNYMIVRGQPLLPKPFYDDFSKSPAQSVICSWDYWRMRSFANGPTMWTSSCPATTKTT